MVTLSLIVRDPNSFVLPPPEKTANSAAAEPICGSKFEEEEVEEEFKEEDEVEKEQRVSVFPLAALPGER